MEQEVYVTYFLILSEAHQTNENTILWHFLFNIHVFK